MKFDFEKQNKTTSDNGKTKENGSRKTVENNLVVSIRKESFQEIQSPFVMAEIQQKTYESKLPAKMVEGIIKDARYSSMHKTHETDNKLESIKDSKHFEFIENTFHDNITKIKELFKQEHEKDGVSVEDFYKKHDFFATIADGHPQISFPMYRKRGEGSAFDGTDMFTRVKFPTVHDSEYKNEKRYPEYKDIDKANVQEVTLLLSGYSAEKGWETKKGFLSGKETKSPINIENKSSELSELSQLEMAKSLGIIEKNYGGQLLDHPEFGAGTINRIADYNFRKVFKINKLPGVKVILEEIKKTEKQGNASEIAIEKRRMMLAFEKEFFDEILNNEIK